MESRHLRHFLKTPLHGKKKNPSRAPQEGPTYKFMPETSGRRMLSIPRQAAKAIMRKAHLLSSV
jgi:hypothetical protein